MKKFIAASLLSALGMWAGALTLQTEMPSGNKEAEALHAILVTRVTACREPAKSAVVASYLEMRSGKVQRTSLEVVPLKEPGTFAVLGNVAAPGVINLAVTNPDYENYRPQVFISHDSQGVEWKSLKQFFQTPPNDSEMYALVRASH